MIDRIEKQIGEKFADNIHYKKSYCVNDFIADYHSYKGNAYGLANTLSETAILKPRMKSKKLSRIELDVVVGEIVSKSNNLKLVKLKEKYSNEIEILNREIDLFKEKFDLLNEEFLSKKVELDKLCEGKDIRLSIYRLDDLLNYKGKENCYNNKKESYYIKENYNFNERGEVYNKLVLMGINSEFNIEELINSFVNDLVNS
jgi:hypothetical protein